MFVLNRRIVGVALLLVLAAIISQCIAAPSNPLKCEEKLKDVEKLTLNETSIHEDIRNLMDSYTDWGELLDSAPFAIYGLGKLIVMSHQKNSRYMNSKRFNYPKSFRNSLLQISRQGNLAFLKAHENMEMIRMSHSNGLSVINATTRYLVTRNKNSYTELLMPLMDRFFDYYYDKSKSAEEVKKFQMVLGLIEEMIVTAKQLEVRRRNAQQVSERNDSFPNIFYIEAIKALQTALNELTKLKTAWTKLIEFYSKMFVLISKSAEKSFKALTEFEEISNVSSWKLEEEETFANLMDKIQKATEAAFLVHEVSDMYVDVSGMYIIDQMSHLDKMMNATEVDMDKLQLELTWSTENDSEGIRHFIKADETLLREKIADRHNQIVNEYKWMMDCESNEE